ncbi:MAG TPA: phenylalanine--tRNA ligase subunit alpha [Trebonia sp.]|jgi:phenylalanyl-tRNA synthetase alpha chain|nr:phenylalanine--tRNA ligase subunit alpha [Trebonia sp.]
MSAPNKNYDPVEVTALSPGEIEAALGEGLAAVAAATDLDELKAARLAHAGDRAPLAQARAEIGALPPQARAEAGKRVGTAQGQLKAAISARQAELEKERDERVLIEEAVDVTLPGGRVPPGARHPVSLTAEMLSDVFVAMGYEVAEGPEVEAEWFNFDALNIPPEHPAREMQDTLFIAPPEPGGDRGAEPPYAGGSTGGSPPRGQHSGMVLRTHTSPVQIRSLLSRPLPLYVVSPGRTYRNEASDATHLAAFYQIEGLAVDEGLTMADLRGAIQSFVDALFGAGLRTRLRPDYFPFTEPSADVSMECHACRGASAKAGADPCRTCRSSGWIEIAGCGMVNPRVLVACGIDPDRYSGFAFGLGIERALMLAHGIGDIKDTTDGDVRFSRAFGMELLQT